MNQKLEVQRTTGTNYSHTLLLRVQTAQPFWESDSVFKSQPGIYLCEQIPLLDIYAKEMKIRVHIMVSKREGSPPRMRIQTRMVRLQQSIQEKSRTGTERNKPLTRSVPRPESKELHYIKEAGCKTRMLYHLLHLYEALE